MRTLVAGFGNVLRGDDGFGVEVIRRLQTDDPPRAGVDLMEVGTAGIRLAQELLTPYDRLIIVDAMSRGGAPGTVYVSEVESVDSAAEVDLHLAVPARALSVAKALDALPRHIVIVGCEPAGVDDLSMELSPSVRPAVDVAVGHVRRLLAGDAPAVDAVAALERRDEVLQVMFWLHGEGFGPDVAVADIVRFVEDEGAVQACLAHLVEDGYLEAVHDTAATRYRFTRDGLREGHRRFMDEFEPYLARSAHGECGSATCDCRTGGQCQNSA